MSQAGGHDRGGGRPAAQLPELTAAVVSVVDLLIHQIADILSTPDDSHAGEIETSIVLHLAPELVLGVRPRKSRTCPSRFWSGTRRLTGRAASTAIRPAADEAKGAELFAEAAARWFELVRKVNAFEEA